MSKILRVFCREIIDSRGNPTVESEVCLQGGFIGVASVPSGASIGSRESLELRDCDMSRFSGKGVMKAVQSVNAIFNKALIGKYAEEQSVIDRVMIDLDGTENKSKYGANAILSVSLAVAKAAAKFKGMPLYEHIAELNGTPNKFSMPLPMINIINGGKHAHNIIDMQEFLIQPISAKNFKEAVRIGVEVFHNLADVLKDKNLSLTIGDEGGYAPNLSSNNYVLSILQEAVEKSGYILGKDIVFAIDCASSEFFEVSSGQYNLKSENKIYSSIEFAHYLELLVQRYPIVSIEDGMSEYDWEGFSYLTKLLGNKVQIVGDDLFVTNIKILSAGIEQGIANSVIIKPNQIGSLTETLAAIRMAKEAGYTTIISHRSGETEDTTIADLAVGTAAGQIKTGSVRCSDRVAKYNQLIRIEETLGSRALFNGLKEVKNQTSICM